AAVRGSPHWGGGLVDGAPRADAAGLLPRRPGCGSGAVHHTGPGAAPKIAALRRRLGPAWNGPSGARLPAASGPLLHGGRAPRATRATLALFPGSNARI